MCGPDETEGCAAARVRKIEKSKKDEDTYLVVLEGLVKRKVKRIR